MRNRTRVVIALLILGAVVLILASLDSPPRPDMFDQPAAVDR